MKEKSNKKNSIKIFRGIIKKICLNAQEGLREFYETHGKIIRTTAQLMCRNDKSKVDKIENEVLVKIWKASGKLGKVDNPEGLIYKITLNCGRDALSERQFVYLDEKVAATYDETSKIFERDSFYKIISKLSYEEQGLMVHRFLFKNTFKEISDELGKPISSLSSVYYRALNKGDYPNIQGKKIPKAYIAHFAPRLRGALFSGDLPTGFYFCTKSGTGTRKRFGAHPAVTDQPFSSASIPRESSLC